MRCLAKLQRCGCSTHVGIPKDAMLWLGWLPGQVVVFEVLEDKSVRFRLPDDREFAPKRPGRVVFDKEFPVPA